MLESKAPVIWNRLSGLICVYKPADTKVAHVRHTIITNICTGRMYFIISILKHLLQDKICNINCDLVEHQAQIGLFSIFSYFCTQ